MSEAVPGERGAAPSPMGGGLATANAPDLRLPLGFMGLGVVSYVLLNIVVALSFGRMQAFYFRNPPVLVALHLLVLGWGSGVAMGALYQLVPVVLQVKIFSERIGKVQFWFFSAGLTLLIAGFWRFTIPVIIWGATILALGAYLFIYNLVQTLRRVPRWNVTGTFLAAALGFFALTVTWGLVLAYNLRYAYLGRSVFPHIGAHLTMGALGWFSLLIIGVGYKLIPMFALTHGHKEDLARKLAISFPAGIGLAALNLLLGGPRPVTLVGLLVVVLSAVLFGYDVRGIMKRRLRRTIDLSLKYALTSLAFLLLTALVGGLGLALGLLTGPREVMALVYLGLMGWISTMIVGMMYKIVPFLVWYNKYAPLAGKQKVPLLKEMFPERVATVGYYLYTAGVVFTALGLVFGWAWAPWLAAAAALVFAQNMIAIFRA